MSAAVHHDKGEGPSNLHQNSEVMYPEVNVDEQERITSPSEALYYTQYGAWYPLFRKHAPKSTVINVSSLQPEFEDWMHSRTIVLPVGSGPSTISQKTSLSPASSDTCTSSDDDEDSDAFNAQEVRLDALDAEIRRVLLKYDGRPVFPKLNWSAPLDSSFMLAGNNLQCLHPEDVYLLLKSSEFAANDVEQIQHMISAVPIESNDLDHSIVQEGDVTLSVSKTGSLSATRSKWHLQLVLKQWFEFNKSYEFRCYVRDNRLVAISQRDPTFYPHLQSEDLHEEMKDKLWAFWQTVLNPSSFPLRDYIFDAYFSKDRSRVWLIDINPWLPRTDPLLFTFEHLESLHKQARARPLSSEVADLAEDFVRLQLGAAQTTVGGVEEYPWNVEDVDFRVLNDERMQSKSATYSANMVPRDLVDFAKKATQSDSAGSKTPMSVDEIVSQWNQQIMNRET